MSLKIYLVKNKLWKTDGHEFCCFLKISRTYTEYIRCTCEYITVCVCVCTRTQETWFPVFITTLWLYYTENIVTENSFFGINDGLFIFFYLYNCYTFHPSYNVSSLATTISWIYAPDDATLQYRWNIWQLYIYNSN